MKFAEKNTKKQHIEIEVKSKDYRGICKCMLYGGEVIK